VREGPVKATALASVAQLINRGTLLPDPSHGSRCGDIEAIIFGTSDATSRYYSLLSRARAATRRPALGNVGTGEDVDVPTRALADPEPLVREHAAWALDRIDSRRGPLATG
jgi:HEAT repeat protein